MLFVIYPKPLSPVKLPMFMFRQQYKKTHEVAEVNNRLDSYWQLNLYGGGELTMHRKKQKNCWKLNIITVSAHPELRHRTKSTKKVLSCCQLAKRPATCDIWNRIGGEKKGQKPLMILTLMFASNVCMSHLRADLEPALKFCSKNEYRFWIRIYP